jgi:hypothetical protein
MIGNGSTFRLTNITIEHLKKISSSINSDDIDISSTISNISNNSKGLIDLGDVDIEGIMDSNNYIDLYNAMFTTSQYVAVITIPTVPVTKIVSNCYVINLDAENPFDDVISISSTVKLIDKANVKELEYFVTSELDYFIDSNLDNVMV